MNKMIKTTLATVVLATTGLSSCYAASGNVYIPYGGRYYPTEARRQNHPEIDRREKLTSELNRECDKEQILSMLPENGIYLEQEDGSYIRKPDGYRCFPDGSRKNKDGTWVLPPKTILHGLELKPGKTFKDFKIDANPENITPDGTKIFWTTPDGKTHYLWTKDPNDTGEKTEKSERPVNDATQG